MAKKPDPKVAKTATESNSHLPEQLRKQLADADTIRADMGRDPNGEPPDEDPSGPPAQPEPEKAPVNPPSPAPQPPRQDPPPAAAASDESDAQKLRSALGRLEQAQRAGQQMYERMQTLEREVAAMRAAGAQPPAEPPAPPKPQLVTPEEVQDFGEDLLNVVGKRAREEYAPEFEQLAARLRNLEGRVEGATTVIQRNQTQELYQKLDTDVPNWKELNRSEDFKAWLQQPDQFSGRRRHDMLTEAFSRHEAPRVVAFFKGFLSEATRPPQNSQARTPSAPPLPGNGNGSGKPSLEEFAAPGRARSAPQELSPDKPIYSSAWIAKFMADKRTGKYRGREADADAIERDIYQAQHEGRIQ